MREIKFRAKSGTQWRYGDLYHNERGELVVYEPKTSGQTLDGVPFDGWRIKVNPETVGQYTGLRDYKGNEIFEGDILQKRDELAWRTVDRGLVFWHSGECRWCVEMRDGLVFSLTSRKSNTWRVIGNIHDNPDLLEKQP